MTEHIRGSPEKLDAGLCLLLLEVRHDFLETSLIFLNISTLSNEVDIVEAVVFDSHLLHELETGIHLVLCSLNRTFCSIPREGLCSAAELVSTLCTESVPPCHRELEPLCHGLAEDYLFRIIIAESHRISTFLAFETDLFDSREKFFCCHCLMFYRFDFQSSYASVYSS